MFYKGSARMSVAAPTTSTERLLGFDAREMWLGSGLWNAERRRKYLLRRDVEKPLSTDVLVWPSLFGNGLPDSDREELRIDEAQLPAFRGPYDDLWQDLKELEPHRARLGQDGRHPHWVIAVTRVICARLAGHANGLTEDAPLFGKEQSREFLGYDVSDNGLLSGLSNCGYSPGEARSLRSRWGKRLNRYHLFDEQEAALTFRSVTEKRVPEHVPFFVYGLWLVSKH
jgi:hypothetical protein